MKINMLSDYLKSVYGKKLKKIALSSGMTCPNRDGTCGYRGCIFCTENGAGEFAQSALLSIEEQIESGKAQQNAKENEKFIAYFQSFTNTYASAEKIKSLYIPVAHRDDIAVISIATRPDCLSDDIISVLSEINKIKTVWVELGLQTVNEKTAEYIRRGYELSVYDEAVEKLRKADIKIITHLIFGLPYETKEDMLASVKYVGKVTDGVKLHNLYIQRNCDLAKLYEKGEFELLSKDEYIDILCDAVRYLPENVVIHRLTGDGDKSTLIAPRWGFDKIKLLKSINEAFYDRDIIQGEYAKQARS
ncbi:MAG: TIGR01212 family radical SAM protein [Ruminococcus sp.]